MKRIATTILASICIMTSIYAQMKVEGIVTDKEGEPIIGVNIVEKGTTKGVVTDLDGEYTIEVVDNAILVFSYVGYHTLELVAVPKLNVVMGISISLDEIVVTGHRIERNERKVNYANQTVSSNDLGSSSKSGSLSALRGKVAGVKVKKSKGNAGSSTNIVIRGTHLEHDRNQYDEINENKFVSTNDEPLSTFSIDVDRASYSTTRSYIERGVLPPKDAVRIEEMINYFDYKYPQPDGDNPIKVVSETAACSWAPQHRLMMVALQGKEYAIEELPPSNLVFLIDVSGSMSSEGKLSLIKQSFRFLVDQLRAEDRVSIVVYAGSSGLVLPSTSGENKIEIMKALNNLTAGGSTAGAQGIELAYKEAEANFIKDGNNRVIIATDGDFNVGINSDIELVKLIEKKRESGVFLTVLGVGHGNYMDGKMQQLAQAGNGNHMYLDNIKEAQKIFEKEFTGTNFTIAKDVKLQVEFNPKNVAAYRLIGYVNRLLENEDFIDDTKDAGEMGAGHTVTALYEVIPVGSKSEFNPKETNLKYSKRKVTMVESLNQELATVKIRYKQPDGNKSHELIQIIENNEATSLNENYLWASLVAEFGMYLSESEFLPKNYSIKALVDKAEKTLKDYSKPSSEQKELVALIKEVSKIKDITMLE